MGTRALGGAMVALAILLTAGCADEAEGRDASVSNPVTVSEFFVAADDRFVFERVDRASPEPLEASEGDRCFTDPAWVNAGAPYDRGDVRSELPTDTQRGKVNPMRQCDLPGAA